MTTEPADGHFTLTEANCSGPSFPAMARFWIELLTLVAFGASRMKGLRGTLLTVFSLSGATFVYLSWWRVVFRVSANAGVPISPTWHYAYLAGGGIVDLFVAALIAWLIVMHVRHAFRQFFSPQPTS